MAIPKLVAPSGNGVYSPAPPRAVLREAYPAAGGRGDLAAALGFGDGELTPRVRAALIALLDEIESLQGDLALMHLRLSELNRLADEDSLLPMANRRAFLRELSRMIAFATRYGTSLCLLFFDVDNLKQVNDGYGHAAGDACLRRIGDLLLANVRGADFVGRLGGDELGVIMTNCDLATAQDKAEWLAGLVRAERLIWQGRAIPLSLSVGVCPFSGSEHAAEMLAAADRAMYRAKGRGSQAPHAS